MARRVVRTKAELTLVRVARYSAWSGSLTAASLVTPPPGALPFGRVCDVIDSLRVTRLHRNGGGGHEHTQDEREDGSKDRTRPGETAGGVVPSKPERVGNRRGGQQSLRGGVPAAGARVRSLHGGLVSLGGLAGGFRLLIKYGTRNLCGRRGSTEDLRETPDGLECWKCINT